MSRLEGSTLKAIVYRGVGLNKNSVFEKKSSANFIVRLRTYTTSKVYVGQPLRGTASLSSTVIMR